MLAQLSTRRPVATAMLVALVVLLGLVSLGGMPVDLLPKMEIPLVAVITNYSGAGPKEVESMVTRPIEEAVAAVANVRRTRSISQDGSSVVMAEFDWGTNIDRALQETRDKVELVNSFLPSGAEKPLILKADPAMMPVIRVAFAGSEDPGTLTKLAKDVVKPALERLDGVAMVAIEGGVDEEVQVLLDPLRLQGYGVSMQQISQVLRMENLNLPGGAVEEGGHRTLVRTTAEFASLDDIGGLVLPAKGGAVYLRDVADIARAYRQPTQLIRLNGRPSVIVSVQKQSGANTVQVSRAVKKAMGELTNRLPAGIRLVTVEDQAEIVESSISDTAGDAWQGALLAALVLLVFLQSLPATVAVAISMPVSLITTFFFMHLAGIGVNLMSLGGLVLGVGMLVDNSIVVLESIFRHQGEGKPPIPAAIAGTQEVGAAISASTFTTVVVFLPILFIAGFAAEVFRELGLTVSFALLVSLLVSVTVLPVLASRANLRPSSTPLAQRVRAHLERLNGAYRRLLSWALGHRRRVVALALASMGLAIPLVPVIGSEFLPTMDLGQVRVQVELPAGTPLARTDEVIGRIEQMLLSRPDAEEVLAASGGAVTMGGSGMMQATHQGEVLLKLKASAPPTRRVVEEIRKQVADIPGAKLKVAMEGGIAGSQYMFGTPISVEFRGSDLDVLQQLGEEAARRIEKVPGTREVEVSTGKGVPELKVKVDRARAAAFGLSAAQVGSAVKAAVEGEVATRYKVEGQELNVRVRFQEPYRLTPGDVEYLPLLGTTTDAPVPLRAIATLEPGLGPVAVERDNQVRVVRVTSAIGNRPLGKVSTDVQRAVRDMELPPGYTVDFGGETKEMNEAFGTLGWSLLLSIVLVYMVMAVQFESLSLPLVIMAAVPFAAAGVAIALAVTGKAISLPSLIGIITMAGVVVDNAIVLLDYAEQLRRRGLPRDEALVEAGATRLRPVLMTTSTTALGLIPMAVGLGRGAEIRSPIAVTLMGGLVFSTILTLVVIPVFYTMMDEFLARWRQRHSRLPRGAATVGLCLVLLLTAAVAPARAGARTASATGTGNATEEPLKLSLQQAVEYALDHNPQVKAAEQRAEAARWARAEAARQASFLLEPPEENKTYESEKVRVLYPYQAEIGADLAEEGLSATETTVSSGVKQAYFSYLQAEAALRTAEAARDLARQQHAHASLLADHGMVAKADVLAAAARVAQAESGVTTARRYLETAKYALCGVLGLDPATAVELTERDFGYGPLTLSQEELAAAADRAEDKRYEVYSAKKQVDIKEKDHDLAGRYPSRGEPSLPGWPLPDSPFPYLMTGAALEAAKADLESTRLRIRQEVYQAYHELLAAQAAVEAAQTGIPAAEEGLRVAQARLDQGAATALEVAAAKFALTQARMGNDQALYAWCSAREKFQHAQSRGTGLTPRD